MNVLCLYTLAYVHFLLCTGYQFYTCLQYFQEQEQKQLNLRADELSCTFYNTTADTSSLSMRWKTVP